MPDIKTYNPKQVTMSFGERLVNGYADDTFITIEPNGDGVTKKVGCDGEIVRSISPDATYVLKLSVLMTSSMNSWLQAKHSEDLDTGDGMFSVLIKDLKGGMKFSASSAWIVKSASRQFGKESNNREWEIHTGEAVLEE